MDPDLDDTEEIPNIPNQLEPRFEPQLEPTQRGPNYKLLAAAILTVVIPVLLILYFKHLLPPLPFQKASLSSRSVPAKLNLARGNVTSVDAKNITVNVAGSAKTFSIATTSDFNKLISGHVETGDAKTGPTSKSELKAGQEVLVIADIGSTEARSIYILH